MELLIVAIAVFYYAFGALVASYITGRVHSCSSPDCAHVTVAVFWPAVLFLIIIVIMGQPLRWCNRLGQWQTKRKAK